MGKWQSVSKKVLLVTLCSTALGMVGSKMEATETNNTIPIQMLGVNDFHGGIDSVGTAFIEGEPKEGVGRLGNLAVHLNEAESEFKEKYPDGVSVRLQGGDLVGGSPANSALLQDEPTIKAFELMNFSIGTLGNHEFDEGLKEFKRILNGEAPKREDFGENMDDDLWNVLEAYPRVPSTQEIVVANIENKTDGDHGKKGDIPYGFNPYTIKTYGEGEQEVKVAYLGIITSEFPNLVLAEHTKDFEVLDEAETIAKYSKELREDGVNAIVVVSHIAATSNKGEVEGEVVDVMKEVDKLDPENSIDVIFAGHNHQFTNGLVKAKNNDVRVVQSTSQGKAYIDLKGELDPSTQDFITTPSAEVKTNTEVGEGKRDPEVQAVIDEANELIKPITEAKVVEADLATTTKNEEGDAIISKDYNSHNESVLGNLITDAQLEMANKGELKDADGKPVQADFALTNDGGIRADLIVQKNGDVSWGAIQAVQPFGNILQVVEITGKDLKSALNEQHKNGKLHYFLEIAGLKMTYQGVGDEFEITSLTDMDGNDIKDDQKYNIIINDFLFGGGDGFKSFTKGKLVTAMDTDTATFVNYFKELAAENKQIEAPELGRKTEKKVSKDDTPKVNKTKESDSTNPQEKNKKESNKTTKMLGLVAGTIAALAIIIAAIKRKK